MQENLSDLIRDEKDSPEKMKSKFMKNTEKNFNSDWENNKCCWLFCSILGIVYFVLKIFEYGFYYLF